MTLDEAIKHAREKANDQRERAIDLYEPFPKACVECAKEHEQLAEWLEELKELREKTMKRPIELYAIEDCINGNIIFNARGGCYKDKADVYDKIQRLMKEKGGGYTVVTYRLSVT